MVSCCTTYIGANRSSRRLSEQIVWSLIGASAGVRLPRGTAADRSRLDLEYARQGFVHLALLHGPQLRRRQYKVHFSRSTIMEAGFYQLSRIPSGLASYGQDFYVQPDRLLSTCACGFGWPQPGRCQPSCSGNGGDCRIINHQPRSCHPCKCGFQNPTISNTWTSGGCRRICYGRVRYCRPKRC
jgi:hypothetical protein